MNVRSFTFNPFQTNCYVCDSAGEAVLVDAASSTQAEHEQIERYIEERGLAVRHLLLTHGHIDHIFGCRHFADRYGLRWTMHRADASLLKNAVQQGQLFGVRVDEPPADLAFIDDDDEVLFGDARWKVLHTPGHSPGSVSFADRDAGLVLDGDVLFAGSIGRTDLWQGSLPVLMESIFTRLVPLGDAVRVLPGHGPETTIGREREINPFLTGGFAPLAG